MFLSPPIPLFLETKLLKTKLRVLFHWFLKWDVVENPYLVVEGLLWTDLYCICHPKNYYVEALNPNVTYLETGPLRRGLKFSEGWVSNLTRLVSL